MTDLAGRRFVPSRPADTVSCSRQAVAARGGCVLLRLALGLLLSAGLVPSASGEDESASSIQVQVRDESLTVDVREAPLADVLRVIGERAHVAVTVRGRLDARVTRSFVASSLEDAFRQLVRGHSTVLIYAPSPDATGRPRLTQVQVVASPASTRATPIRPEERAARLRALRDLERRRDPAVTSELARFSQDTDPIIRGEALAALARRGGREAVTALETALADWLPSVRVQALRGLRRAQGDDATPSLAASLLRDPDAMVRRTAAQLLGGSRHPEAGRALEAAAADPDDSVRRAVAASLVTWRRRAR
jgi:hypothetical protein